MKKNTVSMLISALILFGAGFLVTVITLIYTSISKIDIYPGQVKTKPEVTNFEMTFNEAGYDGESVIKKIVLDSLVGDVNVYSTEGVSKAVFEKTDMNNLVMNYSDGLLTITEKNPVGFMGLEVSGDGYGFNGLRQIFRLASNANTSKKITLYINPGDFNSVINITGKVGDIKIRGVNCSEMYVVDSVGRVTVDSCRLSSALNVKGDKCSVYIKDCSYIQAVVNVTVGDVFALVNENKTSLQSMLGNVTVLTRHTKDDYQLRLSTTMGSVAPFNFENDKKEFSVYSSTGYSLWCQTVVGSITLKEFEKETYPQYDRSTYFNVFDMV